jgi:hypothetical protein
MPSAGFEPAIPAIDRPHTYAIGRAATGVFFLKIQALRGVIFTNSEIGER